MNDVINHKNNSLIWYHTTPKERLDFILKEGLKINSYPTWQSNPEPWIYISTMPWKVKDSIVLEVNLSFLNQDECGWAFTDKNSNEDDKWQLRVFKNIPREYINILKEMK